jgi:hypothetical protein
MPSKVSRITNKSPKPSEIVKETEEVSENLYNSYTFGLFMIILGLVISFFILNWLTKVNKCKCANIKESRYLKEWFTFLIFWQIILAIYFIISGEYTYNSPAIFITNLIIMLINLAMTIRLVIFIHKLKEIKCNCGMSLQENIIYYWYIIGFSILLFLILLTLLGFLISFVNR